MPFVLKFIALIIVYLAAAKIGLTFGTINQSATIFWPPGGIALAIVLLGGLRYLPAVFLAACLVGMMVDTPFIFGLGAAIGNTLEIYIGYTLLKRAGKFNPAFYYINDLFAIIIIGAFIPAIASATFGPLTMLASGLINTDVLPDIMWRWWKSDVLGIVFFTPLILVFVRKKPFFRDAARLWELAAIWVISIVLGQLVFLGWPPAIVFDQAPNMTWLFPIMLWSGLRMGRRNTALIQLLFLTQSLASAYLHIGLFSDNFSLYGLSNFWMFGMLLASIGMGLAILASAWRHAARKVAQHAKVFEVSRDGVMIVDAENNIISVNAAFTAITGYSSEEVIEKKPRLLSSGRHSHEFYACMWKTLIELGHWQGEIWNRRKDGSTFLERLIIHTVTDANNKVISRIATFTDITLQKSEQEAITHQAQHDFLTKLPNRLLFYDRFSQQLAFATRHGKKFAIIYLDLDNFKPVNDTLGHQVGDQLLIAVAENLSALVREIDTVSRFGGDEFAILVSEVETIDDVATLANKVIKTLSEPFHLGEHTVNVSASLGIALYPDHGADMETLMKKADTAMYQAKRGGHNNYIIATEN